MKIKKSIWLIITVIIIGTVLTFSLNFISKSNKTAVFILDKSVRTKHKGDHHAIHWILNNTNTKTSSGKKYSTSDDYYGFVPQKPYDEKNYIIRSINIREINSLTNAYDIFCFVDAHGVFFGDWFDVDVGRKSTSLIYGGLNQNDYLLLRNVLQTNKTVFLEYDIKNYPTNPLISYKFEELIGIQSNGWQCKYFYDLAVKDNSEVPEWMINIYQKKYQEPWQFKGTGYILYNTFEEVIVLSSSDLLPEHNYTVYTTTNDNILRLPDSIQCNYSFEIIDSTRLNVISYLSLPLNEEGLKKLSEYSIENKIPFLLKSTDNTVYYSTADISHYAPGSIWANFKKGVDMIKLTSGNKVDVKFFCEYYYPLVSYFINH